MGAIIKIFCIKKVYFFIYYSDLNVKLYNRNTMKRIISLSLIVFFVIVSCKKEDLTIKEISITTKSETITIEEKLKLEVKHTPENLPAPEYIWRSSQSNIVKVYADGTIEGLKIGESVITVSTKDNLLKSECVIKVLPIDASEIKLSINNLELFIGNEEIITYTILPENTTFKNITWSSENNDIATVEQNGKVKAIGIGETKITAKTESSISASCVIKVKPIVSTSIKLNKNTLTLEMSDKEKLNVIYTPYNTTNKKILWSSSDSSIATVSENGEVIGINEGKCTITATTEDSAVFDICEVEIKLKGLKLSKNYINMTLDETDVIEVLKSTNNIEYYSAKWTSSNPQVVSIISENANWIVIKSIGVGSSTITATSADGSKKVECQVRVTDDIREFITLEILKSGNFINNGFVTGDVYSNITNNSKHSILLTAFYIIDSYSGRVVAATSDPSKLGVLSPGESKNLGTKLNSVYYPIFRWEFTWNNQNFHIEHQYQSTIYWSPKFNKKLNLIK